MWVPMLLPEACGEVDQVDVMGATTWQSRYKPSALITCVPGWSGAKGVTTL